MIDILRKALLYPPQPVSREQFSEWKQSDVTRALFGDLVLSVLEQFEDTLPDDVSHGTSKAYKRDGASELITTLFEWEPAYVKEIEEGDR